MTRPPPIVTFDHCASLRKILRRLTLDQIAQRVSEITGRTVHKSTVADWRDGAYPRGPEWDALKIIDAEFDLVQAATTQ